MYKQVSLLLTFFAVARAAGITETLDGFFPEKCKADCQPWYSNVGDCISGTNGNYSASVNLGDLSTAQFSGDLAPIGNCLCSDAAIEASSSCLACASSALCLEPAVTSGDYRMVCVEPVANGWALFSAHHNKLSQCVADGGSSSTTSSTSSTLLEGGASTSTDSTASSSTPCPSSTSSSAQCSSTPCKKSGPKRTHHY
jgi:hypothetical protein